MGGAGNRQINRNISGSSKFCEEMGWWVTGVRVTPSLRLVLFELRPHDMEEPALQRAGWGAPVRDFEVEERLISSGEKGSVAGAP